jgi:hypothetical protein
MAEEERIFVRLEEEGTDGKRSFKLVPDAAFSHFLRVLKPVGTHLEYNGVEVLPSDTPLRLGMKPGRSSMVLLKLVHNAAGATSSAAAPSAPPTPLTPATPARPKWSAPPSTRPAPRGDDEDSPARLAATSPSPQPASEVAAPPPPPPGSQPRTPSESSQTPAHVAQPAHRVVPHRELPPPTPPQPAERAAATPAPRLPAPAHHAPSAHEIATAIAARPHRAPGGTPDHGWQATARVHSSSASADPALTVAPAVGGPARPTRQRSLPQHDHHHTDWHRAPPPPFAVAPNHALDRHTRAPVAARSPPRLDAGGRRLDSGRSDAWHPVRSEWSDRVSVSAVYGGWNDPRREVTPPRLHHGLDAVPAHPMYSAQHVLTVPPPPPPAATKAEVDALHAELILLRRELDSVRDELTSERMHREVMEGQMRQLAAVIVEQQEQQREAAVDDYAAKEHHRLMATLREQRHPASHRSGSQARD